MWLWLCLACIWAIGDNVGVVFNLIFFHFIFYLNQEYYWFGKLSHTRMSNAPSCYNYSGMNHSITQTNLPHTHSHAAEARSVRVPSAHGADRVDLVSTPPRCCAELTLKGVLLWDCSYRLFSSVPPSCLCVINYINILFGRCACQQHMRLIF